MTVRRRWGSSARVVLACGLAMLSVAFVASPAHAFTLSPGGGPTDDNVPVGSAATFTVAASAPVGVLTDPVWQVSGDHGATWTNDTVDLAQISTTSSGVDVINTTTTLTIADASLALSGNEYRVAFGGFGGPTTSNAATLTVGTPPTPAAPVLTLNPLSVSLPLCESGTATFTAAAAGVPTPTIQWQVSTDGGTTWTDDATDAGATTNSLTVAGLTVTESGNKYRAVFTNSDGSAASDAATLTLNPAPCGPIITQNPADTTVPAGGSATFTAAASGAPAPTVQWQVSTDGGTTWSDLAGATSSSLTLSGATTSESGNEYRAVFANPAGTVATAEATLTVTPPTAPTVTRVFPRRGASYSLVLIGGRNLGGTKSVDFGAGHPAFYLPLSSTFIVALAPPARGTTVDVTVTTANGTSATSAADRFTYR